MCMVYILMFIIVLRPDGKSIPESTPVVQGRKNIKKLRFLTSSTSRFALIHDSIISC